MNRAFIPSTTDVVRCSTHSLSTRANWVPTLGEPRWYMRQWNFHSTYLNQECISPFGVCMEKIHVEEWLNEIFLAQAFHTLFVCF